MGFLGLFVPVLVGFAGMELCRHHSAMDIMPKHHAKASRSSPPSFCHWQAQGAVSNLGDMELWRCPVSVSMHVWGE